MKSHTPVLLSQVGDVHFGPELRRGLVEMNGEGEVVSGIVIIRFGENALEVIERVEKRLADLKPGLPPGVEVHTSYDRSNLILRAIDTLKSVSWALVQEGVSDDINTVRDIALPDYDQDVDPALFNDSGGYPVTCVVNVLYPWTTWPAVDAAAG